MYTHREAVVIVGGGTTRGEHYDVALDSDGYFHLWDKAGRKVTPEDSEGYWYRDDALKALKQLPQPVVEPD